MRIRFKLLPCSHPAVSLECCISTVSLRCQTTLSQPATMHSTHMYTQQRWQASSAYRVLRYSAC